MSDNNGTERSRIIKTQDENGEMHVFELIDILELDGQEYGLLAYVGQDEALSEDEENEEEVVIMRLSKQDDSYTFETIEDDDEFNKVVSYLESETEDEDEEE